MLIGMMVMKNEADRYLRQSLVSLREVCDAIFIADDRSTDDSVSVALEFGIVWSPPDEVPTFMEDESAFRQAAWTAMTETFDLDENDWILSLDADEVVAFHREDFESLIGKAGEKDAFSLRIHEVYQILDGRPQERCDGFWGDIFGVRLARYNDFSFFRNKKMGGGSIPLREDMVIATSNLHLLHLGYLSPEDRQAKFDRYSGMANHGHNPTHIQSIISPFVKTIPIECCRLDNAAPLC